MKTYTIPAHVIDKILDSPGVDVKVRHELLTIIRKTRQQETPMRIPPRAQLGRNDFDNVTQFALSMYRFVPR